MDRIKQEDPSVREAIYQPSAHRDKMKRTKFVPNNLKRSRFKNDDKVVDSAQKN